MAKLILSLDGMVIREYPLTKERTTIGRKAHNDIQIENLAVSGEHAMIMTILNDSFLEDLGSTNGTLVNGQAIKRHFLQNSDLIELGKYKLKYVSEVSAAQPAPADFEKTMVLRRNTIRPEAVPAAPVPAPAPPVVRHFTDTVVNPDLSAPANGPTPAEVARAMASGAPVHEPQAGGLPPAPASAPTPAPAAAQAQGTVQILSGPSAGKEMVLVKALTTLGKPGVQVAVIAKRPQGYFITHVEGTNYPVVNGHPLDGQAHALHDHDVIELAGVKMEFYLKPVG